MRERDTETKRERERERARERERGRERREVEKEKWGERMGPETELDILTGCTKFTQITKISPKYLLCLEIFPHREAAVRTRRT